MTTTFIKKVIDHLPEKAKKVIKDNVEFSIKNDVALRKTLEGYGIKPFNRKKDIKPGEIFYSLNPHEISTSNVELYTRNMDCDIYILFKNDSNNSEMSVYDIKPNNCSEYSNVNFKLYFNKNFEVTKTEIGDDYDFFVVDSKFCILSGVMAQDLYITQEPFISNMKNLYDYMMAYEFDKKEIAEMALLHYDIDIKNSRIIDTIINQIIMVKEIQSREPDAPQLNYLQKIKQKFKL